MHAAGDLAPLFLCGVGGETVHQTDVFDVRKNLIGSLLKKKSVLNVEERGLRGADENPAADTLAVPKRSGDE